KLPITTERLLRVTFQGRQRAAAARQLLAKFREGSVVLRQRVGAKALCIQQTFLAFVFPVALLIVNAFGRKFVAGFMCSRDASPAFFMKGFDARLFSLVSRLRL